jgi:rhamnosyltransferase
MRTFSIASITVAYNGDALLSHHLDALLGQTVSLAEVIVVNNASVDGTLHLLSKLYPEVTVINLPFNAGVGGAYAAGLHYALAEKGHDWVWLFDQDSVPNSDCLERLLEVREIADNSGSTLSVLAPYCLHEDTGRDYPGLRWRNGWKRVHLHHRLTFVDAVISSGSLIAADAIKHAGPPRADFFMDFVDLEHCLRLRSAGYKVAVVRDAIVHHALGSPRVVRVGPFSRVWADHVPWREYYKARNEVFTIWTHSPTLISKWSVAQRLIRHALGVLLFGKEKLKCLKMMYLGVMDGRAGRLGIRSFDKSVAASSEPKRSHA